jgi:hypothetical protein
MLGRRALEKSEPKKIEAIKAALAAGMSIRRIAREAYKYDEYAGGRRPRARGETTRGRTTRPRIENRPKMG